MVVGQTHVDRALGNSARGGAAGLAPHAQRTIIGSPQFPLQRFVRASARCLAALDNLDPKISDEQVMLNRWRC